MYNYAVVVMVLYKYATGVGVMGWRDGYMMRICVSYRLYICFISLLAKSRDAKFCVSRLGKSNFLLTGICLWKLGSLFVRRKILRLYRADAIVML